MATLMATLLSVGAPGQPADAGTIALKGYDATPTGLFPAYPADRVCPELTSLYGSWIDVDGSGRDEAHGGVDGGGFGDVIVAPADGTILALWRNDHGWGEEWNLLIQHTPGDLNVEDDGFVFFSEFDHLSEADIAHLTEGQRVVRGQPIGRVRRPGGNPAYLPEVHWEIYEVPAAAQGDLDWQPNAHGGQIWWNPSARLIDPLFMMSRQEPPRDDGAVAIQPFSADQDFRAFRGFTYLFVCEPA